MGGGLRVHKEKTRSDFSSSPSEKNSDVREKATVHTADATSSRDRFAVTSSFSVEEKARSLSNARERSNTGGKGRSLSWRSEEDPPISVQLGNSTSLVNLFRESRMDIDISFRKLMEKTNFGVEGRGIVYCLSRNDRVKRSLIAAGVDA